MTVETHRDAVAARVCVEGVRRCPPNPVENSRSQDVGPMAPLGRVRRTRHYRTTTTTIYTLGLVCSSSVYETNLKLSYRRGGSGV